MKNFLLAIALLTVITSCKSKKRLAELQTVHDKVKMELEDCAKKTASLQSTIGTKDAELLTKNGQITDLQSQLDYLKKTNTNLLDRMADLSIVSKAGAESIRRSLETLSNVSSSAQRRDSINLLLVKNLKRSLSDINDSDVQVEVKKGVVYVSISDKMLFPSASYVLNKQAETVLGKVAQVINDHRNLDVLVEGHTDVYPISTQFLKDNWDLSVMRATSVVRTLQTQFGVAPSRLTAGGRSEFIPKEDNTTEAGRQANRRTEIVLLPKLDEFFNLLTEQK
ncbi:OmpA family protein [Larkinella sp. C7]|jgi:chemotaxis protein MotB|uniref:OmpA/MotB family protein n=1 Tax=Larkinella sp. C7 TaxID=2576607 RepID=UPI0011115C6B|nr:OmpA family protein [Larkinella sp. C7]